ncbi:MAG: prepilin-type N-terminal cleavage/methylation domain-containing protein [bacterium]|nr:prepilin-type N-terminal cleavage/methylation domain-containing protein [bacterium]
MKKRKDIRIVKLNRGFTLIETMIAILILSVGLIGLFTAFSNGPATIRRTAEISTATKIAQDAMEIIRDSSFATITGWGTFSNQDFTAITGNATQGLANLNSGVVLLSISDFIDSNIKQVSITVQWAGAQGQTFSRSITTLVTNGGI